MLTMHSATQEFREQGSDDAIIWTNRIRFFDRIAIKTVLVVIPAALCGFLFFFILLFLASGGTPEELGGLVFVAFLVLGILYVLAFVAMILLHVLSGGGYEATFFVGREGTGFAGGDVMRTVNNALALSTILTGTGGGLVHYGSDQNFIRWTDIRSVTLHHKEQYILVRPRWIVYPLPLYCTGENFGDVIGMIRQYRPDLIR